MNRMSIIIPHHRDEESLARLIDSLQTQEVSTPFEVIVVSNPPSLKADGLLKNQKNIIHLQSNTVGVNKARNLGIEAAQGDILVFLDSDCEMITDNFLEQHCFLHRDNPSVGFLGGMYQYSGSRPCDLTYNFIQCRWLLRGISREGSRYLIGGHFSCKKGALSEARFDENIRYGGSETELFLRVRRNSCAQLRLYQNLLVGHNTRLTWLGFVKKAYRQGSGASYIHKKLKQEIEANSVDESLIVFEKEKYQPRMEFWLALYDGAYSRGYLECGSLGTMKAAYIIISKIFNFYRVRASNFFAFLEGRLRNLSNK